MSWAISPVPVNAVYTKNKLASGALQLPPRWLYENRDQLVIGSYQTRTPAGKQRHMNCYTVVAPQFLGDHHRETNC
jgi:hypothetical protein